MSSKGGKTRNLRPFLDAFLFTENDPPSTPNANSSRRSVSPPENTNLWSQVIRHFFFSFSECDWNIWAHGSRRRLMWESLDRSLAAEESQTFDRRAKSVCLPLCILNTLTLSHSFYQISLQLPLYLRLFISVTLAAPPPPLVHLSPPAHACII